MIKSKLFNSAEIEFLIEAYKHHIADEIVRIFNAEFKREIKKTQLYAFYHRNKIKCYREYGFKSGNNLWDNPTSKRNYLKIGNKPKNKLPVGHEVVNVQGYIMVKVDNKDGWERKHRVIYKNHFGEIPKNHNIVFKDGNNRNFDIDNLVAVTKAESAIINHYKNKKTPPELMDSVILMAKLQSKL